MGRRFHSGSAPGGGARAGECRMASPPRLTGGTGVTVPPLSGAATPNPGWTVAGVEPCRDGPTRGPPLAARVLQPMPVSGERRYGGGYLERAVFAAAFAGWKARSAARSVPDE